MCPQETVEAPGRRGIPNTVKDLFGSLGRERAVRTGEVLFQQGDRSNSLFLVRSGSLNVYAEMGDDRRELLAVIRAGELVGELEFLDGGTRCASVEAAEDSSVLEIQRSVIEDLEVRAPAVALDLYSLIARLLSERVRVTNEQYKREILRGVESSGTQVLELHYILRDTFHVEICLTGGEVFVGKVVLMTRSQGNHQLTIMDKEGYLIWIPYESIACIRAMT